MNGTKQNAPMLALAISERSTFLLPALTVWVSFMIFLIARKQHLGIVGMLAVLEQKPAIVLAGLTLLGAFSVFMLGHILDLFSQLIFERFLADKLDGFPHERIVPYRVTTGRYINFVMKKRTNLKRPTFLFEGAKLLVSSVVLVTIVRIAVRHPDIRAVARLAEVLEWLVYYGYCMIALACVLAIPVVAVRYLPVGTPRGRRAKAANILRRVRKHRRTSSGYRALTRALYVMSLATIGPLAFLYDLVDRVVRALFRLNKEIDTVTFARFEEVIRQRLGIEWVSIRFNDRFWIPYILLHSAKPDLLKPIQATRAGASFSRNQAAACMLSAVLLAGAFHVNQEKVPGTLTKDDLIALSLTLYLIGWVLHWRFLQQYYSFTKMTFRAVATLEAKGSGKRRGGAGLMCAEKEGG